LRIVRFAVGAYIMKLYFVTKTAQLNTEKIKQAKNHNNYTKSYKE